MLIPEGDWFCPPCQHVSWLILLASCISGRIAVLSSFSKDEKLLLLPFSESPADETTRDSEDV